MVPKIDPTVAAVVVVFDPDDRFRFFKHVNFQSVYSNSDITEYNVQKMIILSGA